MIHNCMRCLNFANDYQRQRNGIWDRVRSSSERTFWLFSGHEYETTRTIFFNHLQSILKCIKIKIIQKNMINYYLYFRHCTLYTHYRCMFRVLFMISLKYKIVLVWTIEVQLLQYLLDITKNLRSESMMKNNFIR